MALLLLPRLGVGNVVNFENNFTVSKDSNPWNDGGADTFDGSVGVQVSTVNGWQMIGGNAYTRADGVIQTSQALGTDAVDLGIYAGWAVPGVFACEVELGSHPSQALGLRFACNTGYDNGSPTGIVTKAFAIGANAYELKTVWTSHGGKDSWNTTGETQITVTVVPFLAAQNAPGANPFIWSGSGDDRSYQIDAVERGATMYIQWGRVNVDAVQDWIIGDLLESDDFASSPHARLSLAQTPPGVRSPGLSCWRSPASGQWNQAGTHPRHFHGIASARRNIHFGGNAQITGTVKEKGQPDQPLVRQVLLYSANTHALVASTWSRPDGAYCFERIDSKQRYTVISTDYQHLYRAVIADNLTPELMP